jgi:hypothetical protein
MQPPPTASYHVWAERQEKTPVAIDADATPWLDRVLSSAPAHIEDMLALVDVWFDWPTSPGKRASIAVYIGAQRVGALDRVATEWFVTVMESARERNKTTRQRNPGEGRASHASVLARRGDTSLGAVIGSYMRRNACAPPDASLAAHVASPCASPPTGPGQSRSVGRGLREERGRVWLCGSLLGDLRGPGPRVDQTRTLDHLAVTHENSSVLSSMMIRPAASISAR